MSASAIQQMLIAMGATRTIYVDSVAGVDAEFELDGVTPAGLREAAPLATLARALLNATAADTSRFRLKRDSSWRETLDLSTFPNANVSDYGAGSLPPRITGSMAYVNNANWVNQGPTYPNVWKLTPSAITHQGSGSNRLTVYEDDELLVKVAVGTYPPTYGVDLAPSLVLCNATAGTRVQAYGLDASATSDIYIHPFGSTDPRSDGKTYEISVRQSAVVSSLDNTTISGIQTERAISNNGACDTLNTVGSRISRVLSRDGTKHNICVGGNSIVQDCIAFGSDIGASEIDESSNNAFTVFMDTGNGETASLKRIGAINLFGTPMYAHSGAPGFGTITLEQWWYVADSRRGMYVGGQDNVGLFAKNVSSPMGYAESMSLYYMPNMGAEVAGMSELHSNCAWAITRDTPYSNVMANNGATLLNCALFGLGATGTAVYSNGDGNTGTWSYSIFYNVSNAYISTLAGYIGDYNVFMGGTLLGNGSSFYMQKSTGGAQLTLAAWQASSGSDANSVYLLQSEQDAGDSTAFWLAYANAAPGTDLTTIGPHVGDYRINPVAKVYGGDGTAYTGTFADGTTAITLAGPQQHWDWMTRAAASGPPERFPDVPETLEECQTYISDPDAWDFYPPDPTVGAGDYLRPELGGYYRRPGGTDYYTRP